MSNNISEGAIERRKNYVARNIWHNKIFSKIHLRYLIVLTALFLLIVVSCFVSIHPSSSVLASNIEKVEKKKEKKKQETIKVDVKGAVVTPGVYELPLNSRVIDAINIAGGLVEGANTSIINLSKVLNDGNVVVVYTNDDLEDVVMDKYVKNNLACPATINDACIVESANASNSSKKTSSKKSPNSESSNQVSEQISEPTNNIVNINTASLDELQTIPGIGKSKAEAIIKYREENGGFSSIDELTNVSGIGDSTLEKIKDNITI